VRYLKKIGCFLLCAALLIPQGMHTTEAATKDSTFVTSQVKNLKVTAQAASIVELNWDKLKYASSYEVMRATSKSEKYKTLTSTTKNSFKDEEVEPDKTYYYKVRGGVIISGDVVYSKYSDIVTTAVNPTKPTITVLADLNTVKITVKKVSGVDGYSIYMAKSKDGTYEKIKTIKAGATLSYTKSGLVEGKTYYFKVRTYNKLNNKTNWGSYSTVKSIKIAAKASAKKPIFTSDYLKGLKEVEEEVLEECMVTSWDEDYENQYSTKQAVSVSFIDFAFDGYPDLVVRYAQKGEKDICLIKVIPNFHFMFSENFRYPEYYVDKAMKSNINLYKDKATGKLSYIGNFEYDNSGASGQVGTRTISCFEISGSGGEIIMQASYLLNYHKVVAGVDDNYNFQGSQVTEKEYKGLKEKYFNNLTKTDYKETIVPYDISDTDDVKRKTLRKAYQALYK